jgi:membrane fusion protein (multidrug efflux system)
MMANRESIGQENMNAEGQERLVPQVSSPNRTAWRSRPSAKWLFALIIILLAAAGYFVYVYHFEYRESTDDAQIDGHINPVAGKVSGTVISINVKDNQFVTAGSVVVQIDPRDYRVALDRAKADLAAAQAAAESARTQVPMISTTTASQINLTGAGIEVAEGAKTAALKDVESARARLESTQARVRETQATYAKAAQDLERMKRLIENDRISKQQYDAAVAAADAAHAARDSAQAEVAGVSSAIEAAQARVVQADARIKEARAAFQASQTAPQQRAVSRSNAQSALARVKQAQAILAQAQLNLEYTEVRAPIDGIISERKVELGQYVQAGQPLLAVVPLYDVWVTANYKENQLKNMHEGQKAIISVDAYGGRDYEGYIDSIAAATGARFSLLPPENATGNYVKVVQRVPVKIVINKGLDAQHPLRPGLSVISTVITRDDRAGKSDSRSVPSKTTLMERP